MAVLVATVAAEAQALALPPVFWQVDGPDGTSVAGINNAGLAVAEADRAVGSPPSSSTSTLTAFSDESTDTLQHSGPANDDGSSPRETATALNDVGTIVGYAILNHPTFDNEQRAIRWSSPTATPVVLGGLLDESIDQGAIANGINRSGLIVGAASGWDPSHFYVVDRAVYWPAGSDTPVALGSLQRGSDVEDMAHAVNDAGTIIGTSNNDAVRWVANSTPYPTTTRLGDLGVDASGLSHSVPFAINRAGTAVGTSAKYDPATGRDDGSRPVRWDAGQTAATQLDVPALGLLHGTFTDASATAINASGTAIGSYQQFDDDGNLTATIALRWDAGGTAATVLPPLAGYSDSIANAINASGAIGGTCVSPSNDIPLPSTATVWLPGRNSPVGLNALLPANSGWLYQSVTSISDTGFITGTGTYDPDGSGPLDSYDRAFTLLLPEAGTYGLGDADFDTKIDFADLLVLAKHYGQPTNGSLRVGDFDLNGVTDFNDLLTLAKHYGTSSSSAQVFAATGDSAFASDWSLAQSLVPEPTSLAVIGLLGCVARRHPRRSTAMRT